MHNPIFLRHLRLAPLKKFFGAFQQVYEQLHLQVGEYMKLRIFSNKNNGIALRITG